MIKLPFIKHPLLRGRRGRSLALAAGVVVLLLAVISCSTVNNEVVMLPDVPGAKYIGSSECEQCHEEIYRGFRTADHSRLIAAGTNSMNVGCESCHGPCSLHSDSEKPCRLTVSPPVVPNRPACPRWPGCRQPARRKPFVTSATTMFAASFNCPATIPCPRAG